MSFPSNAENTTTANQGAHRVVAEGGDENVVIGTALPQDSESRSKPDEGDVPLVDKSVVAAEIEKPVNFKDAKDITAPTITINPEVLKVAAIEDANRILGTTLSIDLDKVGVKDARIIMSEEHKCLGYRPPPDSLAAKAQRSSAKHPDSSLGLDTATLRGAARADAERIKADRTININTLTAEEARRLQSEEQKALGYRPPPGSLSAEAQSAADKRDREPVTKGPSTGPRNHPQRRRDRRKLNKDPASTSTA